MTILSLAEETGIDGHVIRQIIKLRISDIKKQKAPQAAKHLFSDMVLTNGGLSTGLRRVCPDCGAIPPDSGPNCSRCIKRDRDRVTHHNRMELRKRLGGKVICKANELDPVYVICGYNAIGEINGIPVCGLHKARYELRTVTIKCRAIDISDRFTECLFKAITIWTTSHNGEEVPVCGRHNAALNGPYGEEQRNEVWRNRKKEQRSRVDNT